jgi:hypothetical protein
MQSVSLLGPTTFRLPWVCARAREAEVSHKTRRIPHDLEAIAHSRCIEEVPVRAALVGGLPRHSNSRKALEPVAVAPATIWAADEFDSDSAVDASEFFVVEEPV